MDSIIQGLDDLIYDLENLADDMKDEGFPNKAGYLVDAADCLREAIGELEKVGNVRSSWQSCLPDDLSATLGELVRLTSRR